MSTTTATKLVSTSSAMEWLRPVAELERYFNEKDFGFKHRYGGDPLFTLDNLIPVAESAAKRPLDLLCDAGKIKIEHKWNNDDKPKTKLTGVEALAGIHNTDAWVIIKHVEKDPAYAEVLAACTKDVMRIAGSKLGPLLSNPEMLIIVSSPNRITPFHFDGEVAFLLQTQGTKVIRMYDRSDRSIVTEEEVERFYTVDKFAGTFKPGSEDCGTPYELRPGDGVHIAVNAPHWVQNGPEPSVSININYELPESLRADIFRANHYLRKMGIQPAPAGKSAARDRMKATAFRSLRTAKVGLRKLVKPGAQS